MIRRITPEQLWKKWSRKTDALYPVPAYDGAFVIEIDPPGEFDVIHPVRSVSLPIEDLDAHARERLGPPGREIVIVGSESRRHEVEEAARRLLALGYPELYALEGGREAWIRGGWPTVTSLPPRSA